MKQEFENARVKGFLHADGRRMVNGCGEEVLLRGWGMGNWNNPEGFMLGGSSHFNLPQNGEIQHMGRLDRGRSMDLILRETCGTVFAGEFWKKWHRAYLSEGDIRLLHELGYNSVRLPIRACCFLEEEPGIHYNEDSFAMLEKVLDWCEAYQVYAVIDLHAAAGAQSCLPCDDGPDNAPHLFLDEESAERTIVLCEEIARRLAGRWIVGAYDYINEPLSAMAPNAELEEKLRSFYLELVSRVRKLDKNHMFLLNGTMFSSKVHIFDRNFDPECNNWGISIHCYGARPEVASFGSALRKSRELNVPVWMGETGGENEWMSSLYELLLEHHIGFNIWCWKSAEGSGCAGTLRFQLPEGWELIRNYAENGGPKPSYAHAQELWEEYLERVKVENCRVERENQAFILRNGSFSLPGVCYDALPEGSFRGSGWYGGFTKYRAADRMDIVYPDSWEPGPMPMGNPREDEEFSRMVLCLHAGDYAGYTVRSAASDRTVKLEYRAESPAEVRVSLDGDVLFEGTLPLCPEFSLETAGVVEAGRMGQVRVEDISGSLLLRRVRFETREG